MESYKIDVSGFSIKDKELVQSAAFKLGCTWTCGRVCQNLHALFYYLEPKFSYINYGMDLATFIEHRYKEITLQQLLKLAGMENDMTTKQFSKKDLVAGKHVVKLADGSRYLLVNVLDKVVGFNLQADSKGVHDNWYTHLEEDLVYPYNKDLSVVAVYKVVNIDVYCQCSERNIELIWKREEKSATQTELEKLQQQIVDLQDQVNKLQSTL